MKYDTTVAVPIWLIISLISFLLMLVLPTVLRGAKKVGEIVSDGPLKQVFLVRQDLKMGGGKTAAQCAHAAVKSYKDMLRSEKGKKLLSVWETLGQAKIVLKVPDETALLEIADIAKSKGINVACIRDAGRTQIAAGSLTVCALGPADVNAIDEISGHLKLL
jgi:PTH2 family peptidyl-tRNA hydrolase